MRINSVNNNYHTAQTQQSFGAIRGENFDSTLNALIRIFYDDSDKLTKLAAEQTELAKTGEDFNSKFERLVITNSKGEEVHPVIDLQENYIRKGETSGDFSVTAMVGSESKTLEFRKYYFYRLNLEYLYRCIEYTTKKTTEAMAGSLEKVRFLLGIKPPPKPLAEVVLPEFSALSGIPEEHAKLKLPEIIAHLSTPAKPATEKELLEIAQEIGCMPPSLTAVENSRILDEVERLSPKLSDDELLEILELKKNLDNVA